MRAVHGCLSCPAPQHPLKPLNRPGRSAYTQSSSRTNNSQPHPIPHNITTSPFTHLILVPCRRRHSQNVILNTTRRQMIQDTMVRQIKHAIVVLDRRRSIQDWLPQEPGERRRVRQLVDGRHGVLVRRRLLWLVKVDEVLWYLVVVLIRGEDGAFALELGLLLLGGLGGGGALGGGSGSGFCAGDIVGAYFDVVDEVVAEVDGRGEVGGCLHYAVDEEADVVGAGEDVDCGLEDAGVALSAGVSVSSERDRYWDCPWDSYHGGLAKAPGIRDGWGIQG